MVVRASDLVSWVRRYEAAARRIDEERRAHPLTPDESLDQALALAGFVERVGLRGLKDESLEDDLAVHQTWARLRRAIRG
jgi:hypothetical protein